MSAIAVEVGGTLRSLVRAWDLLLAITTRDLRVRYEGAILSYLWWIAQPLALGAVLYFALGRVVRLDVPNYPVFLLSALFPWFWFSAAITQGSGSITSNSGLLKKVSFPKLILPLSTVFSNTLQFILTLPILVLFIYIAGMESHVSWLLGIPLLLVLQTAILVGLGTFLACVNVFSRDLSPFLGVLTRLMFYLTPIIYPLDRVPGRFRPFMSLNPIAPLIEAWRDLFMQGTLPGTEIWPAAVLAVASVIIGVGLFRLVERYFADAM